MSTRLFTIAKSWNTTTVAAEKIDEHSAAVQCTAREARDRQIKREVKDVRRSWKGNIGRVNREDGG